MKFFALITLFFLVISIIDAAPIDSKPIVISLTKNNPNTSCGWLKVRQAQKIRALVKFQNLVKTAYASDKAVLKQLALAKQGKSGEVTLDEDSIKNSDIAYFGKVTLGNQNFNLLFDTGSSDAWVPNQKCKATACKQHKAFDPKKSKNFKLLNKPFNITYGSGNVSGVTAKDDLSIAGIAVKGQIFGLTLNESQQFENVPYDGLMGMALDQLSAQNATTPFSNMVKQKSVKDPFFSFSLQRKLDKDNGSLTLGGVDKTKFVGDITFNKLVSNIGFWLIGMDDACVNNQTSSGIGKRNAIIDTGTTLLIVPQQDAETIHNNIPGAKTVQNQFVVPCNTTASVALTFGGVSFSIDPRDLAFQPIDQDNLCASGIAAGNIGGNKTWLVGDTFLKNVYSVFNVKNLTVGFAKSKIK